METGGLLRRGTGIPQRLFPGTGADGRERQYDLRHGDRAGGTADGEH